MSEVVCSVERPPSNEPQNIGRFDTGFCTRTIDGSGVSDDDNMFARHMAYIKSQAQFGHNPILRLFGDDERCGGISINNSTSVVEVSASVATNPA